MILWLSRNIYRDPLTDILLVMIYFIYKRQEVFFFDLGKRNKICQTIINSWSILLFICIWNNSISFQLH